MKVLHYVNEGNLAWARPWMQLLDALRTLGVENVIMCPQKGTLSSIARESDFEVKNFTPLVSGFPLLSPRVRKIIHAVKPDLIHTRLSSAAAIGGFWGKKTGVPVVATLDKYPNVKYYKKVDRLVGCSRAVSEHIIEVGIPEVKVVTIHNPVLFEAYRRNNTAREELRVKQGVSTDQYVILGAGRFVDWKAFNVLIEAISILKTDKNWVLWLVGDGPKRGELEAQVKKYGLNEKIRFHGFKQDVRPFLWASDLFVQPSNKPEGFSLMLLEAMASGLPAIATSIGGTPDIIKEGNNGWMVETNEPQKLSLLIKVAIENTNLKEVGANASKSAESFKAESIAKKYLELYEKTLSNSL